MSEKEATKPTTLDELIASVTEDIRENTFVEQVILDVQCYPVSGDDKASLIVIPRMPIGDSRMVVSPVAAHVVIARPK